MIRLKKMLRMEPLEVSSIRFPHGQGKKDSRQRPDVNKVFAHILTPKHYSHGNARTQQTTAEVPSDM